MEKNSIHTKIIIIIIIKIIAYSFYIFGEEYLVLLENRTFSNGRTNF